MIFRYAKIRLFIFRKPLVKCDFSKESLGIYSTFSIICSIQKQSYTVYVNYVMVRLYIENNFIACFVSVLVSSDYMNEYIFLQ